MAYLYIIYTKYIKRIGCIFLKTKIKIHLKKKTIKNATRCIVLVYLYYTGHYNVNRDKSSHIKNEFKWRLSASIFNTLVDSLVAAVEKKPSLKRQFSLLLWQ